MINKTKLKDHFLIKFNQLLVLSFFFINHLYLDIIEMINLVRVKLIY